MRTVIKTYKFKLYQNKKNRHLDNSIDIAASIWNYCIAVHRHYYRAFGKHLSANRLMKHITKVKKTLHPEWKALGSQAIQDVVQRVDRSYKAFFDHMKQKRHGRKSPPSFKKRSRYSSFTLKQAGYTFHSGKGVCQPRITASCPLHPMRVYESKYSHLLWSERCILCGCMNRNLACQPCIRRTQVASHVDA